MPRNGTHSYSHSSTTIRNEECIRSTDSKVWNGTASIRMEHSNEDCHEEWKMAKSIRMHSNAAFEWKTFECLKNHHWGGGGGGGPGLGFGSQQLCCLHYVADAAANFQWRGTLPPHHSRLTCLAKECKECWIQECTISTGSCNGCLVGWRGGPLGEECFIVVFLIICSYNLVWSLKPVSYLYCGGATCQYRVHGTVFSNHGNNIT